MAWLESIKARDVVADASLLAPEQIAERVELQELLFHLLARLPEHQRRDYRRGVLTVQLPKTGSRNVRTINVS